MRDRLLPMRNPAGQSSKYLSIVTLKKSIFVIHSSGEQLAHVCSPWLNRSVVDYNRANHSIGY